MPTILDHMCTGTKNNQAFIIESAKRDCGCGTTDIGAEKTSFNPMRAVTVDYELGAKTIDRQPAQRYGCGRILSNNKADTK